MFLFLVEATNERISPMANKVFIKNFGCSSNTADGEVLAGCLAEAGFQITSSETEADVLIYNTCAVKGPTENRIIDTLKHAPKDKKIIVSGCLPMISFKRLSREANFSAAVGPALGKGIVAVVKQVLAGEQLVVDLAPLKEKPPLTLPRQKTNPVISLVPINFGCLGSCTYCCVVFARGHLRSYSIQEVVDTRKKRLCSWRQGILGYLSGHRLFRQRIGH
jgi:threonylcarbamoyladenosine tRNA methylthiotransferase CDKAL1